MKKFIFVSTLLFSGQILMAQNEQANPDFFADLFVRIIVIVAGVVMLTAILVLYQLLMHVIRKEEEKLLRAQGIFPIEEEIQPKKESIWRKLYLSWTAAVPVEHEEDVLIDHGFDGIRELDNKLPPWWVALFYITIIWGVAYMFYYHVSDAGPSSYEEYVEEVRKGEEQTAAFLASQANQVDENTVTFTDEPADLEAGKSLFIASCAVCHGQMGEGGVGPNFADDYYVHGGDIKDIFKVIKYGVPEKGMISWKSQIRPLEMQQVASYIMTLRGTDPPNQKDPEGELYTPDNMPSEVKVKDSSM